MSAIPSCIYCVLRSILCLICLVHPLLALRAGEKTPLLFRAGGGRRVHLWDGEKITGQVLDLNKETLQLRTVWTARLELPRAAVASIDPLPGWRIILDEDFRKDLKTFRITGEPALTNAEDGTAARALLLRTPGQSLTYTLRSPPAWGNESVTAGRVGINFQEREQAHKARWTVELLFQQGKQARRVTATVAGDGEHYAIDVSPLSSPRGGEDNKGGTARQVKRTPGWHRLIVQFSKHSLRLTCDDDVLWYNLDEGPGGYLQQVTIRCQHSEEREMPRGAVAWTELCIERAVDEHPQPSIDAEQDAVRLLNDDHLFGRILQADRHVIQIAGRFGKRSLPWTAVSGCSLRRPVVLPKANEGAKIRLLFHSGLDAEPDVLEGVIARQDGQHLVLRHALLGDVVLERNRVRELRSLK